MGAIGAPARKRRSLMSDDNGPFGPMLTALLAVLAVAILARGVAVAA